MQQTKQESFDNAEFWDKRYRTNIALGSGAGSRGAFLEYKRALLQELVERLQPRSILDIGCGDLEVTRELDFNGVYTGIDTSSFVIERNQRIRPEWDFIHGDFLELAESGDLCADLVICLDVLIHQHERETYLAFVQALLGASRMALLVNSFESLPRSGKLSPNVAYHEPITRTLRESGARKMRKMGRFRRTLILLVAPEAIDARELPLIAKS